MSNRRDLLKTMALLPLAACTSTVEKAGLAGGEEPSATPIRLETTGQRTESAESENQKSEGHHNGSTWD